VPRCNYATIDGAGATSTEAVPVNLFDGIVRYYHDSDLLNTGFQYDNGHLTPVSPPGATTSQALGINLEGVIVDSYNTDSDAFGFTTTMDTTPRSAIPTAS
jgi:hypothetical protein